MMSVACCTSARNRASLSAEHDARVVRLVDQTGDAPGDPEAATPVITASTTAALEPESSRMTTAGAANNAAPSTTIRARPWRTRPASPASQSARIDGCMTAAASRKYEIGHSASSAPPSV